MRAVRSLIAYRKLIHDRDLEGLRDDLAKLSERAATEKDERTSDGDAGTPHRDADSAPSRSKTKPRSPR